jgi:hypothetical protein
MTNQPPERLPKFPCPSCGFVVFSEPSGSYDICPLCNWEDDPVQLKDPGMHGGANGGSLHEYQLRILQKYPVPVTNAEGYCRDSSWRPLRPEECVPRPDSLRTGMDYFLAAAGQDASTYYWKSNKS